MAIHEDILVIKEGHPEPEIEGLVHVFDIDGNFLMTLRSPEPGEGDLFGTSIAVNEEYIVVGEVNEEERRGRVYIYDREGDIVAILDSIPVAGDGGSIELKGVSFVGFNGELLIVSSADKVFILGKGSLKFEIQNLVIDPVSVDEGDAVVISCDVSNKGTLSGLYSVCLRIDGEVNEEKTVSLDAGGSESVSFEVITAEKGSYSVDVNGLSGSFEVKTSSFLDQIPGFPLESLIFGLGVGIIVLWRLQQRK